MSGPHESSSPQPEPAPAEPARPVDAPAEPDDDAAAPDAITDPVAARPERSEPAPPQPAAAQPTHPTAPAGHAEAHPSAPAAHADAYPSGLAGYAPAYQAGPAGYAPAAPRPNPFAGVPWRDYATDLVALALLCTSLSQSWSFFAWASDRVEVVVITIISILSLGVFYVGRATGWSARTVLLVRALANVPYGLLVCFYVVADAAHAFTVEPGFSGRFDIGLGNGLALGLAGVALAVAPRQVESDDHSTAEPAARLARSMLWTFFAIVVADQVLALVALAVLSSRFGSDWETVVRLVLTALVTAGLAGWPLWGTLRRLEPWRWVLVAVGGASLVGPLLAVSGVRGRTQSHLAFGVINADGAFAFVAAAAAVALAPAIARSMRPVEPPVRRWFEVARAAWLAIAVAAAAETASWIVRFAHAASLGQGVPAWAFAVLVLFAVVAVAAVVVRATFAGDPVGTRSLAIGVSVAMLVVGCFLVGLGPEPRVAPLARASDVVAFSVAFALPLLALLALLVPAPVRAYFAAHGPQGRAEAAVAPPTHGFTVAQASDPGTELAVLAVIAERAPELRPYVALNPSTYPDLLGWLAGLHDPAVDAALAARRS